MATPVGLSKPVSGVVGRCHSWPSCSGPPALAIRDRSPYILFTLGRETSKRPRVYNTVPDGRIVGKVRLLQQEFPKKLVVFPAEAGDENIIRHSPDGHQGSPQKAACKIDEPWYVECGNSGCVVGNKLRIGVWLQGYQTGQQFLEPEPGTATALRQRVLFRTGK